MASERRRPKRLTQAIGFFLGAVLLGALVRTGTAFALCGPAGSASANNTACGTGTLTHNTTGTNDSAFGSSALFSNPTGYNNTASGVNALQFNTTGYRNSAFGTAALKRNTTGTENTASRFVALGQNATGFANTASGARALELNITGHDNIGLGAGAGSNIEHGSNDIESATPALSVMNPTPFASVPRARRRQPILPASAGPV
jgi:hypothetical protein